MYSCSTTKNTIHPKSQDKVEDKAILYDFTGTLSKERVEFLKNNYDWVSGNILIINFLQLRSDCHFDNHKHSNEGKRFWKEFYSKINTDNCSIISVCAGGHKNNQSIYKRNYDVDKNGFLLNNYFKRKKSCFGVMVINEKGDYLQYNGHYYKKQVSKYIENLR